VEKGIVQNMISRLGQSQVERESPELAPQFVPVDERTPRDLLLFAREFARFVHFAAPPPAADGDWQHFFPYSDAEAGELPATADGAMPPHLALFVAFLKLYEVPRAQINTITARHLAFFYEQVLRFVRRPPSADRAHLLIELKKGASPVRIQPGQLFSGGKGPAGELLYTPTFESVVNVATVDSLRSVLVDRRGRGSVRFAVVANSADGFGAPATDPRFRPFGYAGLPVADLGFAIASPVLRLGQGRRRITVSMRVSNAETTRQSASALSGAFTCFLTGDKSWIGPFAVTASIAGDRLQCQVELPDSAPAVVDYKPDVHVSAYAAQAPVMQILLNAGSGIGYSDLQDLRVESVQVSVAVSGVTALTLESDAGPIDPKKAFLPFGPQPTAGSSFMIGYPEALSKQLSALSLSIDWQAAPSDFSSHYANYGRTVSNSTFTASVSFTDGGTWSYERTGIPLFGDRDSRGRTVIDFSQAGAAPPATRSSGDFVYALSSAGASWARSAALRYVLISPMFFAFLRTPPAARQGFIVLSLDTDFLHAQFRKKTIQNALGQVKDSANNPIVLNEPYTPSVRRLELSYSAQSREVAMSSVAPADFADSDVQFFHVDVFGPAREHAYQRSQLEYVFDKRVPLLPPHPQDGEFIVGLGNLAPRDSVNVLFQAAEGSADPELPRERVEWSVLCDNYWKRLGSGELIRDTTNQLLTSGIVSFVIPREATTMNTLLPAGQIWLKAAIARNPDAVSQLVQVAANAVEVQWIGDVAPAHLSAPLPAGRIVRHRTPLAAIKAVTQPAATFGGAPAEGDRSLRVRASERLRHRNRAITPWDYERLVLDAFPSVHRAKCVPHANGDSWLAPGNVLVVVVPDLRNQNMVDPLQPRVDADTLTRISSFLDARAGMHGGITVRNPRYQLVRLDFKVRFRPGFEFNFYRQLLEAELVQFLSPWAFDASRPIEFGGRLFRSVVLNFVEERAYVDYVTDFKLLTPTDGGRLTDVIEAQADRPDAILVSDRTHAIAEVG
jgi:hypothetical protein